MNRPSASWVGPVAAALAADRRELLAFVKDRDAGFWELPSVVAGWRNRDILAHLAGGNDQLVQTLLRAIVSGEELDPREFNPDTDAENEQRIAERRDWSVEALIEELTRDSDEVQSLLAQLKDSDRDLRPKGLGMSVGKFLRIVEQEHHDLVHLRQLQSAANQGHPLG